ncbi:MAG TPA: TM2 domain-containing protein, partial [Candidatus Binatus sp.]|nr:TM2 domain-containing protein [Candidatus Binatus sp.]
LVRTGWKYDAVSAEQALAEDHRAPVVYVRSFRDDQRLVIVNSRIRRWFAALFEYMVAISPEQELAMIMNRIGPLVAIGKPGEPLPELGAARFYVGDDQWQDKIIELMKQAKLVVVRVGGTANLQWEIDRALALLPLQKLIFFFLGFGKETELFARELEQRFGPIEKLASSAKMRWLSKWSWLALPQGYDLGKVVYFAADRTPQVEPIRFTLSWKLVYLSFLRPYAAPLSDAFRRVFTQLDLPWIERKQRSTAALLALFGGIFGLHEFYLGHRRRGVYCVLFFWTMIPFFMGWIDAIKFALLDEQEFQRRFIDGQVK